MNRILIALVIPAWIAMLTLAVIVNEGRFP